jgi:hypothetical protein
MNLIFCSAPSLIRSEGGGSFPSRGRATHVRSVSQGVETARYQGGPTEKAESFSCG